MLKKWKEKNKINELLQIKLFEVSWNNIYYLMWTSLFVFLIMLIFKYDLPIHLLNSFSNLNISNKIAIFSILSTSIFSFLTFRLNRSLAKNQNKKEIREKFSLPKVGATNFQFMDDGLWITINVEDENKKYMKKYKVSNIEITMGFQINSSQSYLSYHNKRDFAEWEQFYRINNELTENDKFNKCLSFSGGRLINTTVADNEKNLKLLKNIFKNVTKANNKNIVFDFTLEIENIYEVITKVDVTAYLNLNIYDYTRNKEYKFEVDTIFYDNLTVDMAK